MTLETFIKTFTICVRTDRFGKTYCEAIENDGSLRITGLTREAVLWELSRSYQSRKLLLAKRPQQAFLSPIEHRKHRGELTP
jgi:hypothetical protein